MIERIMKGTHMPVKTFKQIVDSISFDELMSLHTQDAQINIAAFARWIYMAHVGWRSFNPEIKNNFKNKITQLYNHPPEKELSKKLDEILITTLPDRHCSVRPGLTHSEEKNIPNKVIDRDPPTSVGKNIAFESEANLHRKKIQILFQKMVGHKSSLPIIVAEKDGIGIFGISTSVTTKQDQDEINEIYIKNSQHWKAVIIDMRGNSGGDSRTTDTIAKTIYGNPVPYCKTMQWRNTPEAKYVLISRKNKQYKDLTDRQREHDIVDKIYATAHQRKMIDMSPSIYPFNPQKGFNKPVYILIDRHTASSGEGILTQLRGHPLMTSIGEYSAGCGQYGNMGSISLPNGSTLRLGTDYRTYDEGDIEGIGRKPDVLCSGKDAMLVCLNLALKKSIALKRLSDICHEKDL